MLQWLIKVWFIFGNSNRVIGLTIGVTESSIQEEKLIDEKTEIIQEKIVLEIPEETSSIQINFQEDLAEAEEAQDYKNKLILFVIAASCISLAVLIIGAGLCLYKKYGASHYGSGHIRILSEDGSVEEEVMYIFQTNGKIRRESSENFKDYRKITPGRHLGYFYTDPQGNLISSRSGIVNPSSRRDRKSHNSNLKVKNDKPENSGETSVSRSDSGISTQSSSKISTSSQQTSR